MPAVDRNVLRLGVWELLYAEDVPDGVAVSEAMAWCESCPPTSRRAFVNGVLGADPARQGQPGLRPLG